MNAPAPLNKDLSLNDLLEENKIVIPMLQRDYAQGRSKDEHQKDISIRYSGLVDDIMSFLTDKTSPSTLKLDFIYGQSYKKDNQTTFEPIDGQQRITTLWLVYWYIRWRREPQEDYNLGNFSYETRISSRDFIRYLVNNAPKFDKRDKRNPSEIISQNVHFHSTWKQDPNIEAMLNMLDYIHENFSSEIENLALDKLNQINFHKLDLNELNLADTLYIKMNARGLPLSPLENFKADLKERNKDTDWVSSFIGDIQTQWVNLYWNLYTENKNEPCCDTIKKGSPPNIEDKLWELLCRFIMSYYVSNSKLNEDELKNFYDFGSATHLKYDSKTYCYFNKLGIKNVLDEFRKFVTFLEKKKIDEINKHVIHYWDRSEIYPIIPTMDDDKERITQPRMVIFHALVCYVHLMFDIKEKIDPDLSILDDWMHLVWNIVENSMIRTYDSTVSYMKLVGELAEKLLERESINSIDFYDSLSKLDIDQLKSKVETEQLYEEIEKAKWRKPESTHEIKELIELAEQEFKGFTRIFWEEISRGDAMTDHSSREDRFKTRWEKWKDFKGKDDSAKVKDILEAYLEESDKVYDRELYPCRDNNWIEHFFRYHTSSLKVPKSVVLAFFDGISPEKEKEKEEKKNVYSNSIEELRSHDALLKSVIRKSGKQYRLTWWNHMLTMFLPYGDKRIVLNSTKKGEIRNEVIGAIIDNFATDKEKSDLYAGDSKYILGEWIVIKGLRIDRKDVISYNNMDTSSPDDHVHVIKSDSRKDDISDLINKINQMIAGDIKHPIKLELI